MHDYTTEIVPATDTKLGVTKHTCSVCGNGYVDTYTLTAERTQTQMPDGTSIHDVLVNTASSAHEVVDVGDGQRINVYLHDPLESLVKRITNSASNGDDDYDMIMTVMIAMTTY